MFSSKTPRDLNHDPHPWLGDAGHANTPNRYGSREVGEAAPFWDEVTHDPRPEFDHVQHNPPNPILSAFRNDVADVFVPEEFDVAAVARSWIDGDALDLYEDMHDSSLIDHARKVLQRLMRNEWQ